MVFKTMFNVRSQVRQTPLRLQVLQGKQLSHLFVWMLLWKPGRQRQRPEELLRNLVSSQVSQRVLVLVILQERQEDWQKLQTPLSTKCGRELPRQLPSQLAPGRPHLSD